MDSKKQEIWVIFSFGVFALSLLFAVAIFAPDHNALLITVSRVTLALACAGVAAIIPGFLDIEINKGAVYALRAGGALAVFVLVFFFNPPALLAPAPEVEEESPPVEAYLPTINRWFALIDAGDIDGAYRVADDKTREDYPLEFFRSLYDGYVAPLGKVRGRTLMGAKSASVLSSGEKGVFRIVAYETEFEKGPVQIEQLVLRAKDGKWFVHDHTFTPKQ